MVVHEIAAEYPDVVLERPAGRRLRDADRASPSELRRPGHREPVRRHPVRRGVGAGGQPGDAALGLASATRRTAHGLHGLYEPIHGSAPDIAGQDLANPIGTILSAALLLRWSLGRADAADAVEAAVGRALDDGFRTADLWPRDPALALACTRVGTVAMADAIVARIGITGAAA